MRKAETPEPILAAKSYTARDIMEEMNIFYDFLAKGIDKEDIAYLQKSYELLLSQEALQVLFPSFLHHKVNFLSKFWFLKLNICQNFGFLG